MTWAWTNWQLDEVGVDEVGVEPLNRVVCRRCDKKGGREGGEKCAEFAGGAKKCAECASGAKNVQCVPVGQKSAGCAGGAGA